MELKLTPYFMMDGNTKDAIQFYEKALDAKVVTIQTYGEVLPTCPSAIKGHVAHAMLKVGESVLLFSDTPGPVIEKGNQLMISISTKTKERSKQIFETLQQGGKVNQLLEETPFSSAFGNVTDKFGITFQVVTEREY